tara:strand:- start:1128 stop:2423 length:1296 start_codon:yes stop_codon:yes gene_type:complete
MLMIIKKKLYQLILIISSLFIELSMRINSYKISAFIIWLNIRRVRIIKFKSKNLKKVLVFPKSGGYEDLIESYANQNNNNIAFFILPRQFLRKFLSYYFKNIDKKNYFTKPANSRETYYKNQYIKYLTNTFSILDKFIKLDGFISFNIFNYTEKYLEEVFKNLNKKYVVLHKESTFTPIEEINSTRVYKKYNTESLAHKISVYSENQKKILIKSKIAKDKQVYINGCPRSDYSFRLRKTKPKKNILVYYLIEKYRGNDIILKKSNINWKKLYDQTLEYLIDFAKKNRNVKIIFKGKIGSHKINDLNLKILPKNCSFVVGGTGEKFLKDASVVIAFNSTIVLEAIASNRNLIIPNFNKENIKKKGMLLKITNKKYFVNTKKQFNQKINLHLNSKYKNRNLSDADKKTLKYYLGIIDGKSGKKVQNFLNKTFN